MKYALISARQLIEVYAALTTSLLSVKGKDFNLVKEAMSHLESLKPSDPVAWKKTIDGSEITRSETVASDLGFTVPLFALEQSK